MNNKKLANTETRNTTKTEARKPSALPRLQGSVLPRLQEKYSLYKSLTQQVIGLAINVHKKLGPGFVERLYQRAMYLELKNSGLKFQREKKIIVRYNNAIIGYEQVDFDVEEKLLVELKAVSEIQDIHKAQLLSYLKASGRKLGIIINFAKEIIEIKRVINEK